jgi:hypothetical protein
MKVRRLFFGNDDGDLNPEEAPAKYLATYASA